MGLRRTYGLRTMVEILVAEDRPLGWAALTANPRLREACNPSSAFRILVQLEKLGIVRRLAAAKRSYCFALDVEGRSYDQIVCTFCGSVEVLPRDYPLEELAAKVRVKTNYQILYHQLTFFGVCPTCLHARKADKTD